uniref:Autophagy-related protein 13 n=1 Tax=Psilocybe cubensis TaxID=181762 RepID=A0A8H7XL66_PSICU
MSNDILKADQIAFHFYTKLFYAVNHARATEEPSTNPKPDKWFNLETPDSDLFTKEAREPYRSISLAPLPGPPTLELQVLLSIPDLTNNQVLVYMSPDSSRVRIEPTPKFILLETWSLGMTLHRPGHQPGDNTDVALPIIYKQGIILFRSVFSLLRVLPVWKFYKRLKRKVGGINRNGHLGIKVRVRPHGEDENDTRILGFDARLSPTYRTPLPTSTHNFHPVPHLFGTFNLSTTYLNTPNFQLDELESLLSSRFISLDLEGFIPTLDKNRQRDSMSGSSLPTSSGIRSSVSRSPPRAIGKTTSGGSGADSVSVAERFILPSRVSSMGAPSLGMTASSGTSALIPPPRPFPSTNPSSNTPHAIPSQPIPASGLAVNRLRKESLNSSSSSLLSTRDLPLGPPAGTSSLSSSPVSGALPIRRPNIGQVHPFKSNTFSSNSGSSPSLSIRQGAGGSGSPAGGPSVLSGATHSPIGNPARLPPSPMSTGFVYPSPPAGATTFAPSSLGDRRPGTSGSGASSERDRDRRMSVNSFGQGSGIGMAGGGNGEVEEGRAPVPVPMPTRKRYSSSFGHRYAGSVGSGTGIPAPGSANSGGAVVGGLDGRNVGGSGSTPGSGNASGRGTPASLGAGSGQEGKREDVISFLNTRTDDDDISIFVQDIEERKPLTGRTKEREKQDRDRVQLEQQRKYGWHYEERGHGLVPSESSSAKGKEKERSGWSLESTETDQRRRRLDGTAGAYVGEDAYTTSPPPLDDSPTFDVADLDDRLASTAERAAQLSTSPNRGPMLTSQNEVDERLKQMNERFLKSLEGLGGGSTRRKKNSSATQGSISSATSVSQARDDTSTSGSSTSRPSRGLSLGFPSRESSEKDLDPNRLPYPPYFYTSGSGQGVGRGRHSSTSSSTMGTSEGGASQGSEEVIGRMELYEDKRKGRYQG